MSFRITTSFIDESQTVAPVGSIFGASAILDTLKGPTDWRFVGQSQPQTLLDLFGYPSVTNPAIQDLIDANSVSDIFVCSPVGLGAMYGGAFVTEEGTIPFVNGTTGYKQVISGQQAVISLAITGTATGAGSVNISLNGAGAVDIPIADGDINTAIATKIGAGTFVGWTTLVTSNTVTFTATSVGALTGANTFGLTTTTGVTGVYTVTNSGSNDTIDDYSNIQATNTIGVGNGTNLVYISSLINYKYYKPASITLLVNGVPIALTESTLAQTETYTGTNVTLTYVKNTGAIQIAWTTGHAPVGSIVVNYRIDIEAITYFTLYDKYQQFDDVAIQVSPDVNIVGNFNIRIFRYSQINQAYNEIPQSPVTVGLTPNATDANGVNVYIKNVFDNNQILFYPTIQNTVYSTMTGDISPVAFSGGNRGSLPTNSQLALTYETLKDKLTYPVKVIFDTTGFPEVAQEFISLRGTDGQPGVLNRVRFMLPTPDVNPASIISTPATYNNGANDRGIWYYCLTWGIHSNLYTGVNFNCSNMGLVAGKALAMLKNGPGGAIAWQDENGVGGQLGGTIVKLNQSVLDSQLKQLNNLHFNAVINHPSYGIMIENARTMLQKESDYSYISASSITDWVLDIIETQVLPAQIYKFNDDYHQSVVRGKADTVMRGLSKYFESYAIKCDNENNNASIKNARKFVLTIGVVFTKDAATVSLIFVNSPSGSDSQAVINKTA